MPLGAALKAALDLPAARGLPSSVRLIQSGDAETAAELASGFGIAIVVGVLSLFCVLALLFKDFLQPITILSVLPLSFGGAFVALLVARSELDLPAMIGVVMLIGIVTKNSILLVEHTVIGIRERGLPRHEAVLEACRNRARAIVMTTFAMTAVAAIGGLLSSTSLSLLVVPVVFTYIDGLEQRLRRLWHRESLWAGHEADALRSP
jgi:multidrug efflux pump subunit AcrB